MVTRSFREIILAVLGLMASASARGDWVQSQTQGDLKYFLFAAPARIERYDIATRSWLQGIPLSETPTAFLADESALYVSYGRRIVRLDRDGGSETHLANTVADVSAILAWNEYLYLRVSTDFHERFFSVRKLTGQVIASTEPLDRSYLNPSVSQVLGRIYGRGQSAAPQIRMLILNTDGTFGPSQRGPFFNPSSASQHTFVFPNGKSVVDHSGIVYDGSTLEYENSFAGTVDAIAFYNAEIPIVLRAEMLVMFSPSLLETGRYRLSNSSARDLAVSGDSVLAFSPINDGVGVGVVEVALNQLQPVQPGPVIDPRSVSFTADDLFLDRHGVLYLFSQAHQTLFRWDTTLRQYSSSIPVTGNHRLAAYSSNTHSIYLAGDSGKVDQILLESTIQQKPFAAHRERPTGLIAADTFVFVSGSSGHSTYNWGGTHLSTKSFYDGYQEHVWSPATRTLYAGTGGQANDIESEVISLSGDIGPRMTAPQVSSFLKHPIRVSPDGRWVLFGSGVVYDAASLRRANALPIELVDAIWVGNTLVTIREIGGLSQIQLWTGEDFIPVGVKQLTGRPRRLFFRDERILAVTEHLGAPLFYLLDRRLNVEFSSPQLPLGPSHLSVLAVGQNTVDLAWRDNSDNELGFLIEATEQNATRAAILSSGSANSTNGSVTGLHPNTTYVFKIRATNEVGLSTPTFNQTVRTVLDDRLPAGPPFQLRSLEVGFDSIVLAWNDKADNEKSFLLERRSGTNWTELYRSGPNLTTFHNTDLLPRTSYRYRVRAINDFGESEVSPELTVRTLSTNNLPPNGAPTSLYAAEVAVEEVTIQWLDGSDNETGFIIERAQNPAGPFSEVGRTGMNITSFTDGKLHAGTAYTYQVQAYNAFGAAGSRISLKTRNRGGDYLGKSAVHQGA